MQKYTDEQLKELIELAIMEYECIAPFGGDILNGLDIAIYDMFENEEDEPEGLFDRAEEILRKDFGVED